MSRSAHPPARRLLGALAATLALLLPVACADGGPAQGDDGARATAAPSGSGTPGQVDRAREHARTEAEKEARRQARKRERTQERSQRRVRWRHPVIGADISWPQCPAGMGIPQRRSEGQPPPLPSARYVVIGLTNGPAFTPNPCLADQLRQMRARRLPVAAYAVVSWPAADRPGGARHDGPYDAGTRADRLRNAGYAQGRYNIATLQRHDFRTPAVWVDVEPYPAFPWSPDVHANAQVVRGVVQAYRDAGLRVGIYSTPSQWREVVGDLRFGVPEWRAAGHTSRREALARCAASWSIQGGPALMGQWTDGRRDHNTSCPGVARRLDQWFHHY